MRNSIVDELQRRRPKPLPPSRPAAKKPSSLPPPSRSSCGSLSAAAVVRVPTILNPGAAVRVRTRTTVLLAAKALELWLWLPGTIVSASPDGTGYEVVYNGKLPPGDPSATVYVTQDHVVPEKQPTLVTDQSSRAVAAASKSSEMMQPQPRPTRAGKSLRLVHKLTSESESESEMQPPPPRPTRAGKSLLHLVQKKKIEPEMKPAAPRPTTAGKSMRLLVCNLASEMEHQAAAVLQGY